MSQNKDQALIDKIINGDINSFAELVNRYKFMVYTLSLRMLKNREEAEEVSQDTFVKVYGSMLQFKGYSKLSTWIYKIAYRRCLDYLKKRKKRLITQSFDDGGFEVISSEDHVLHQMEVNERKAELKNAIQQLPGDDGILITLHYFEELSLNEISEIMSLPTNTLKVRLFRARKRLAKLLRFVLEPEIVEYYGEKKQ